MSETVTIEDFSSWIERHLANALASAGNAIAKAEREAAAHGRYRSGSTITFTFDAVHKEFGAALASALGELKRAIRITNLDPSELRSTLERHLWTFTEQMNAVTKHEKLREFGPATSINERLAEFDKRLAFALRQFDVGLLDPLEPVVPLSMTNSLNIGVMSGGAVQQGAVNSPQNVNIVNVQATLSAIRDFEEEISGASAQLTKPTASKAIISEAGRSIRGVLEGVVAGALTPQALRAGRRY